MGCASCAQKYAALKASRQAQKNAGIVDSNEPRKIKPARRGIIRQKDKAQEVAVNEPIKEEPTNETNTTD